MLPNDAGGLFLSGHFKWVFFFVVSILVIEEQLVTRIEMQLDSWVHSFSVRFINSPSMVWQSINQKVIYFFFSLSKKGKHKSDRPNCTRCLILWLFSGRSVAQEFFFHLFCDARWKVSHFCTRQLVWNVFVWSSLTMMTVMILFRRVFLRTLQARSGE